MYIAIVEEAVQDTAITIRTLLFHSAPTIALFDSGSVHTFIAKTFINRIGVSVENLSYDLVVSTPTRVCVRGVIVDI